MPCGSHCANCIDCLDPVVCSRPAPKPCKTQGFWHMFSENGLQNHPPPPKHTRGQHKDNTDNTEDNTGDNTEDNISPRYHGRTVANTILVSADKASAVSAERTSVVSLCQQTSPKTSPRHSPHRGGRFAAAPVGGMLGGMSWEMSADTMTQQMSCLLTQQMSCLQTQQMSCLQTQ